RKRLQANAETLATKGLLYQDDDVRIWRVMTKVSAVTNESYGVLTESVRRAVTESLHEGQQTASRSVSPEIITTGLSPVMHETQVALLTDLGTSFVSAFVLITPVLMLIVRSMLGGLLLMLPNVLPVMIAFGAMGGLHWSLDIAGILTAGIALGIAVDDTLHFVCWYFDEIKSGCSRIEAVQNTFAGCTRAMIHTTLISCGAMLPFLFASFVPTQQFAKLMIVMLSLALVADLVLLPAILVSPLGAWITKARKREINH
ncbi:MAG: MMPL family transporter, partial [Pirellula sp.]|nr:MMPL family transporter [Pirellula sp.]